jgi:acyl carrier protein
MKRFIVETLDLENIRPEDIGDDMSLFKDGLGLDSIDAFELGIALRKKFKVRVNGDDPSVRNHFRSASSLLAFLNSQIESPA